ncbi:GntR family transcriptional regulator [Calorimonas adulescens]|jgi:transcriptional regulator, GntR family|uniref:GntR family transcriptional regulator n=1 Tax=Calorimonas adulescens TaxID=2606906 RepID=A0A5D8QEE1_9THEO|nr:GntR family transcriptional regulator [Calorimonas adulescens]TZE82872.1 GntR family transcriptional regulator [Calorimonas adulescens]
MDNFNPIETYKPLRDLVFEYMKEGIISGEFKPGQRLMEVQLASKLGVSRTPIREAIRKLELEGLVIMMPRKGAYVSDLSQKDILEVFEVRTALEGLAAALAAERMSNDEIRMLTDIMENFKDYVDKSDENGIIEADTEFHNLIFQSTRNDKLIQINNNLQEQLKRFRIKYLEAYKRPNKLIPEHERIVEAIKKRTPETARKAAERHLESTQEDFVRSLSKI